MSLGAGGKTSTEIFSASLGADVLASLRVAARNSITLYRALEDFRAACAHGRWSEVEPLREKMLAALDGYVDHFAAASMRLERDERIKR